MTSASERPFDRLAETRRGQPVVPGNRVGGQHAALRYVVVNDLPLRKTDFVDSRNLRANANRASINRQRLVIPQLEYLECHELHIGRMDRPVAELSRAKLAPPMPAHPVFVIRTKLARPQPQIPIQMGGHGRRVSGAGNPTRRDVRPAHIERVHILKVRPGVCLDHLHRLDALGPCLLGDLVLALIGVGV